MFLNSVGAQFFIVRLCKFSDPKDGSGLANLQVRKGGLPPPAWQLESAGVNHPS